MHRYTGRNMEVNQIKKKQNRESYLGVVFSELSVIFIIGRLATAQFSLDLLEAFASGLG